ncbi:protein DJ-1 [Fopius arisanus]|uniref:Protein DJ-1 n=1 Tax=Fopius arisanus TaxID=64838 RepID=A0A9R1TNH0_9HYME|nr:PREDICTED: protein DJ-1-like [Fopius arisanus]
MPLPIIRFPVLHVIGRALEIKNFSQFCKMSKKAILLMGDGAEEMEAVITADVLRRAGVAVTIASITGKECVKCSKDTKICTDAKLSDVVPSNIYDVVILPGGLGGSQALAQSKEVGDLLKSQEQAGRIIAAICAAPTALKAHGIGLGKKITSYPGKKDELSGDYNYLEEMVVVDDKLITSRGPATTFAFALTIVSELLGKNAALPIAKAMLYTDFN